MLKLALITLFSANIAQAIQFGDLVTAGADCANNKKQLIEKGEFKYELPLFLKTTKTDKKTLVRSVCTLRLPIAISANEKIEISDLSQIVKTNLGAAVTSKYNLKFSLVGKPEISLDYGFDKKGKSSTIVQSNGLLFESECGKDVMLAANVSLVSSGKGIVVGNTEGLQILIKTARCNN